MLTRPFVRDPQYYEDRAHGLVEALASGVPEAVAQARAWHPDPPTPFDLDAAKLVYARQHGHPTWTVFMTHVRGMGSEPFLDAFEAMRGGRFDRFADLLRDDPSLARARGTNGNTLLSLAVSLAGRVCGPLPPEAVGVLDALLAAGADVDEANDRGWTPLHQAAYANQPGIAKRLIAAGARIDRSAHGEGGTPLAVALFWGYREAGETLAAAGVVPRNLRIAAGLGRLELIDACFGSDGALTPEARSKRGFYRPHSGFPLWSPSDDPQEILDEALVWAAKADRAEALAPLVARGARLDADPYRGTPLLWAASNGRLAATLRLIELGANVNRAATFGGPSHGERVTALHLAAQGDHAEVARALLAHGADREARDALYDATPGGWAEHAGSARVRELLS